MRTTLARFLTNYCSIPALRAKIHPLSRSTFDSILSLVILYSKLTLRPASPEPYPEFILKAFKAKGTVLACPVFDQGAPPLSQSILQNPIWTVIDQEVGRQITQFLILDACLLLPQQNGSYIQISGKPLAKPSQATPPARQGLYLTKANEPRRDTAAPDILAPEFVLPLEFGLEFPPNPASKPLSAPSEIILASINSLLDYIRPRLSSQHLLKKFRQIGINRLKPVPKHRVATFITAALRYLLPPHIFGAHNWQVLTAKVTQYIKIGRCAKFYLENMTQGLRITETWIPRATSKQQARKNQLIFQQFMYWIFRFLNEYLLSLFVIRSNGTQDLYFKLHGWKRAVHENRKSFASTLKPIENPTTGQKLLAAPTYILPKPNGSFRTIINLKRHKSSLSPANQVLHYHALRAHELPQIRSPTDAFALINNYLHNNPGKVYVVRTDIQGCFDGANSDTVLKLVKDIVSSDYTRRSLVGGRLRSTTLSKRYEVAVPITSNPFATLISSPRHLCIEQGSRTSLVTAAQVRDKVSATLGRLLVRVGDSIFHKTTGIPQGSTLSGSLCDILCQDFIRTELARIWSLSDALCLRYVDDFLFVSTSLKDATLFLKTINRRGGFPRHGISFSPEKTETNFGLQAVDQTVFLGIPLSMPNHTLSATPSLDLDPLIKALQGGFKVSQRAGRLIDPVRIPRVPVGLAPFIRAKARSPGDCGWIDIEGLLRSKTRQLASILREVPPQVLQRVIRQSVRSICRLLLRLEVNFCLSRRIIVWFLHSLVRSGSTRGAVKYGVGIWVSIYRRSSRRLGGARPQAKSFHATY